MKCLPEAIIFFLCFVLCISVGLLYFFTMLTLHFTPASFLIFSSSQIYILYNTIERWHDLCSNMDIVLHAISLLGPTIQPPQTEPWFIFDLGVPPHSYIHFGCSWHQPKQAWWWRAGIAGITGFLAAFLAWSLAMCSLFLPIWSEICLWYRCAHLDCKSLETYSSSMKQGWVFLWFVLPSRPTLLSVFDTSLTELGSEFGNDTRTDIKYGRYFAYLNTSFHLPHVTGPVL